MAPNQTSDELMSSSWVRVRLGISQKSLDRMCRQTPPPISFIKVGPAGKIKKFRRGAVEAYIDRHEIRGGERV
jgi:hypothetical protein